MAQVGCEELAHRGFNTLSGGEKQRVLIAQAIAQGADHLILDEPTNHLDIRYQVEILELVSALGVTVLAAIHDLSLAALFCDTVHLLSAWVSGPLPGKAHDAKAFRETGAADIVKEAGGGFGDKGYQGTGLVTPKKKPKGGELTLSDTEYNSQISSFRAPVERLVAHFKNWKMLHTDYRCRYSTYHDAFDAARALFSSRSHGVLNNAPA